MDIDHKAYGHMVMVLSIWAYVQWAYEHVSKRNWTPTRRAGEVGGFRLFLGFIGDLIAVLLWVIICIVSTHALSLDVLVNSTSCRLLSRRQTSLLVPAAAVAICQCLEKDELALAPQRQW